MTDDGVGEVLDFMAVDDPDRASDRHRLVRMMRCVRGQIRFQLECAPRFDYGHQPHELELTEQGAVFHTPTLQLTLHGGGAGAARRDGNDVRGELTVRAGQTGGVMLESAAEGPPRTMTPEELGELFSSTARLARLAGRVDLPGTLAGDRRPLGHHPQADDLCPQRRPGRRPHRRPARAGRRRAQLGLPLHLDPRRLLLGPRPVGAGVHRGGRSLRELAERACRRPGRRGVRAAEDHVPGGRLLRPGGGDPRPLRGVCRLQAGPDRQRRRRPAPAGHLRRAAGLGLAGRPARHPGRPPRVGPSSPSSPTGSLRTGTSRTRASGRPAAAGRTSPTAG
jgi:hypothetical protein